MCTCIICISSRPRQRVVTYIRSEGVKVVHVFSADNAPRSGHVYVLIFVPQCLRGGGARYVFRLFIILFFSRFP